MAKLNLHFPWALPACLLCSSLALQAAPDVRKIHVDLTVMFGIYDPSGASFVPSGSLTVKDSAGNVVKDVDGDPVAYKGDGKDRKSMEGESVVLKKGDYTLEFTPMANNVYDFKLAFIMPKTFGGKHIGGGAYVVEVSRAGAGRLDVSGDWVTNPAADAAALFIAESPDPTKNFVDIRQQ
jgi:hypothetical protein